MMLCSLEAFRRHFDNVEELKQGKIARLDSHSYVHFL